MFSNVTADQRSFIALKKLLDFFKVLNETNSESKRDLINCLKKVVDFEDYIIGDSLDSRKKC